MYGAILVAACLSFIDYLRYLPAGQEDQVREEGEEQGLQPQVASEQQGQSGSVLAVNLCLVCFSCWFGLNTL